MAGFADKLAARARDAARRQTENAALLAMIREEGELALKRGDRKGAETAWSRMLELVVEPADRKTKKPSIPAAAPAAAAPVPAASVPAAGATSFAPVSRQSHVRMASYQAPAQKAARKAATPGAARGPASPRIELADPDPRPFRAGDADRAAGRGARPARVEHAGRARRAPRRPPRRADQPQRDAAASCGREAESLTTGPSTRPRPASSPT